ELRVHVDVALAVGIPEVNAFAADHGDRIDRTLSGPGEDRVSFGQVDDVSGGHRNVVFGDRHDEGDYLPRPRMMSIARGESDGLSRGIVPCTCAGDPSRSSWLR